MEAKNHHQILRLKVTGGFLDGLDLEFTDGLNCIIGGRGSGKTTVIEFLRYGLDLMPDQSSRDSKALQKKLSDLIKYNLEYNGLIEIEFLSREGIKYTLQRPYNDEPVVIDENGESVDLSVLESGVLIGADIFSQNQIEEIAGDLESQLPVIDRFDAEEIRKIKRELDMKRTAMRQNAMELQQLEQKLDEVRLMIRDLPSHEKRLEALNKELGASNIEPEVDKASEAKRLRDTERETLNRFHPVLGELKQAVTPLSLKVRSKEMEFEVPEEVLQGKNGGQFQKLRKVFSDRINDIATMLQSIEDNLALAESTAEEISTKLNSIHGPEEAHYQEILKKVKDNRAKIRERDQQAKKVNQLTSVKSEEGRLSKQIKSLQKERAKVLGQYSEICDHRFELRCDIAESLNDRLNKKIKVEISQDTDIGDYIEFLSERMKGSGKKYGEGVKNVSSRVPPHVLADLIVSRDCSTLAEKAGINEELAEAMIEALSRNKQDRYDLEIIPLDDEPEIKLKVGKQWRPTNQLSTGQMCSVFLPILLLDSIDPLLIDQPEDNLDNSYLTDTIVPQLRDAKSSRQMIFITHNPNIPVLGDAENVVVMESDGSKAVISARGNVDRVKTEIQNVLEGGKAAFEQRRQRYGK